MNLFPIVGQEHILRNLHRTINKERVGNAYLFYGPEGAGKEGFALEFAAILNCISDGEKPCRTCHACRKSKNLEHPNIKLIFPLPRKGQSSDDPPLKGFTEKEIQQIQGEIQNKSTHPYSPITVDKANSILINSIREVRREIYLTPAEEGRKVYIIFQAHLMTIPAANALLKILEEPPGHSVFILTSSYIHKIPATIRSRCQQIYFPPLHNQAVKDYFRTYHNQDDASASALAMLSAGNLARAEDLLDEDMEERSALLSRWIQALTDGNPVHISNFVDTFSALKRSNPSAFHATFQLLIHWFRDLAMSKHNVKNTAIPDNQLRVQTKKFISEYPDFQPDRAVATVEKYIDFIERNVYIQLSLFAMMTEIHRLIIGSNP